MFNYSILLARVLSDGYRVQEFAFLPNFNYSAKSIERFFLAKQQQSTFLVTWISSNVKSDGSGDDDVDVDNDVGRRFVETPKKSNSFCDTF